MILHEKAGLSAQSSGCLSQKSNWITQFQAFFHLTVTVGCNIHQVH